MGDALVRRGAVVGHVVQPGQAVNVGGKEVVNGDGCSPAAVLPSSSALPRLLAVIL